MDNLTEGICRSLELEELYEYGGNSVKELMEAGVIHSGDKVLDFGAGIGRMSLPLKKMGCEVVAIERMPIRVDHMKSLGIDAIEGDDLKPVKGETFDYILSIFVFQHMGKNLVKKIIKQASKLTDKLYFTIPTESFIKRVIGEFPKPYELEKNSTDKVFRKCDHSYVYKDEDLDSLWKGSGFKKISLVDVKDWNLFILEK